MNPWLLSLLLMLGVGGFTFQLAKFARLLFAKATPERSRTDHGRRFWRLLVEGLGQRRLYHYPIAGLAHHVIFFGFGVLILRTLMLFGRGFSPGFQLFWFAPTEQVLFSLGNVYQLLREVCTSLVLVAVTYFFYLRLVRRERRLTLSREGLVILGIIFVMMLADLLYDACGELLRLRLSAGQIEPLVYTARKRLELFVAPYKPRNLPWAPWVTPASSLVSVALSRFSSETLLNLGLFGYYAHVTLVLVFLNLLPVSKHFHVLLALPNVYLSSPAKDGALSPLAQNAEQLLLKVESAYEQGKLEQAAIGKSMVEHWSPKARLDWFACTECGRCEEHCPAHRTGKTLSPKQLTLTLREQLKREGPRLLGKGDDVPSELVPKALSSEAIWACTTCRACEEQCPVRISYLESIVGLRQNLVMMRGEVAPSLQRAFDGMERNGNPWNYPKCDRAAWASGLDVPLISNVDHVQYLYWVGCAASYDERAKSVARAFAALMRRAKVTFAILGEEERCTGDSARRAGNELLFLQLAEANISTLGKYQALGRFSRIVTTCPHCLTTLRGDYASFGASLDVISHVEALDQWVAEGRLTITRQLHERLAFHDPCTLARGAGTVIEPRRLLRKMTSHSLSEPLHHGRQTLCCGAGGAQMWLEEQNKDRINVHRALELADTGAAQVVSACPFCLTMITDGLADARCPSKLSSVDLSEVLLQVTNDASTN